MIAPARTLWPHQEYGINEAMRLIEAGERALCITSPTGGGKSDMMVELLPKFPSAVIYSNRRILTEQLREKLHAFGFDFGIRAAGYEEDYLRLGRRIQISSVQTEKSRVYDRQKWQLHDAKLVIVDEAHMQTAATAQRLMKDHLAAGASVVGFTATPLGIYQKPYTQLVVAGTNSQLRECGAHLPCNVFAPDEPDLGKLKPTPTGEYTEDDIVKKIWTPAIFGRVLQHYNILNPDQRPAICCCPSVPTAVWMAQQFTESGIEAASLDGEEIVWNGERVRSTTEARSNLMQAFADGQVKVITFRYVLREAWDFPALYHLMLATPIGSLMSYLQVVGRLLRNHPSLDHVVLQDHGGSYWRHGSPNANRDWLRTWQLQEYVPTEMRLAEMREKKEPEPIVCPKCKAVRLRGSICHHCGHESSRRVREILQLDGTLREVHGDILKPRRTIERHDTQKLWNQTYWRCKNSGRTFRQAEGLFVHENHYWPPRTLKNMPANEQDWFRKVKDVPPETLTR